MEAATRYTRIDYAVEVCSGRGLLWDGAVFQILFAGLYRKRHSALRSVLATFAQNMPYYEG